MADKPLTAKRQSFCQEYASSGHNGAEAYRRAYPLCKTGHKESASFLLTIPNVKQEISRIEAKRAKKLDLSREGQHKKLEDALTMAKDGKNPAAMTSAIREQNEMLGYHRDKAPNTEREEQIRARMGDEELAYRKAWTKQRTKAETGLKLAKEA